VSAPHCKTQQHSCLDLDSEVGLLFRKCWHQFSCFSANCHLSSFPSLCRATFKKRTPNSDVSTSVSWVLHKTQIHPHFDKSHKFTHHPSYPKGVFADVNTRVSWVPLLPGFRDQTCHTGWRRRTGCLKLQVIFRKRASNYRVLLRKITSKDRASYGSLPLWSKVCVAMNSQGYITALALCCDMLQYVAACFCVLQLVLSVAAQHIPLLINAVFRQLATPRIWDKCKWFFCVHDW